MSADQSSESISATTSRNVTIYVNVMYITRGIKDVTHILENYNMRYIWTERHFLSNKIHIFFGNFFFCDKKSSLWNGHVLCSDPRCCQHVFGWCSVSWELSRFSQERSDNAPREHPALVMSSKRRNQQKKIKKSHLTHLFKLFKILFTSSIYLSYPDM